MKLIIPELLYTEKKFKKEYAVLVDGTKIKRIGNAKKLKADYKGAEVIMLDRQVLIPGTVNAHNHCFQSLLRGIAADKPFLEWRDRALYHYSPLMTLEDIYNGALFAFGEMLKRGVTCVGDFFYLHNYGLESDEAVMRAAKDLGIRLALVRTMYDWDGAPKGYVETVGQAAERTGKLAEKYQTDPMINIIPAPHSLHAASEDMILAGHELAEKLGTKYHMHVAEEPFEIEQVKKEHHGLAPMDYLDQLGVVDDTMVIIHGVWLKPEEIELFGSKGGSLVYCPSSNMFLADGITDIPRMMKAHVKIGLGSDGGCSNNRISVFEEMRMVSLLQKAKTCDALCVNYEQAFTMGTENGAEILGFHTGKIEEGYEADLTGIYLDDLSMMPVSENLEQVLPNIVYSMEPGAVKTVIVQGKTVILNGTLLTVEEERIRENVKQTMKRLG
ncbi:MAG TPA: amidohydrolase [Lachnospiraceae bacterium]|nr:amidohydrolase [Lachnospiraceae bacterium]